MLDREITLLFTSEGSDRNPDDDLQFMSDGVIEIEMAPQRRSIRVAKFRGSGFANGDHDLCLDEKGMSVFPQGAIAVESELEIGTTFKVTIPRNINC